MVYIETPHLLLRDWEEEDILPFVRMNSDKEVMEFFLTTLTEEETMAFYCRIRKEFEEYGYGLYAVECKETQNFLGYVVFSTLSAQSIGTNACCLRLNSGFTFTVTITQSLVANLSASG